MNKYRAMLFLYLILFLLAIGCTTTGSISKPDAPRKIDQSPPSDNFSSSPLLSDELESAEYLYGIAKFSLHDNDLAKALDSMKLAIEQDPHSSFLNYRLGLLYLDLARDPAQLDNDENLRYSGLKRAEYYLENAQVIDPEDTDILIALAEAKSLLGQIPVAVSLYEKALDLKPEYIGLLKEIASELYRIKRYGLSLDYIKKFLKSNPNDDEGHYIAGLNYVKMNDLKKSRSHLEKAFEGNPYNADLVLNLGLVYESTNEFELAESTYRTIANISPKDSIFYRKLVRVLLIQKKYDEAREQIEKIIEYDSDDYIWPYYLGLTYELKEQFEEALPFFQKAYEMNDDDSRVVFDLTFTLMHLEKYEEAFEMLQESIQKFPKFPAFYQMLGDVYTRAKDFDKALEVYQQGLEFSKDKGEFLFQMAIVYEQKMDEENTEKTLLQLLKLEPKNSSALNFLGYLYAEKGVKLKKAEKLIIRALEIEPDNGAYLDSLGWVYYKQKKYEKALIKLLRANDLLESSDPVVIDHIGDTLKELGCYAKALKAWSFVLSLEPENQAAASKIKENNGLKDMEKFDCDAISLSLPEN